MTSFWRGRRVLVTGDTGFKGSWLVRVLRRAGANVWGYALEAPTTPNLFELLRASDRAAAAGEAGARVGERSEKGAYEHVDGDVRDFERLLGVFERVRPEVVLHLAAQPIVLDGYADPRYTYDVNVMGTVNVLEAARLTGCARSLVNVTTDKVYLNEERPGYGYAETDRLDGFDPYSNSKSCSELVTETYARCFLAESGCAVSTARAGNVIGGGDFAPNRIVPDCVRAVASGTALVVRNPASTRPYQHVLEPLFAYLTIAEAQWADSSVAGAYNVGPNDCDCVTTGEVVELFARAWSRYGNGNGGENEFSWIDASASDGQASAPHEATFLKLDSTKMKETFGWQPCWHIDKAVRSTAEWSHAWLAGDDVAAVTDRQIDEYRRDFLASVGSEAAAEMTASESEAPVGEATDCD